ncbi:hypothetical protein AMJ80_01230 [bacterium SM23_31]|nr:MAG: hypothetical protein AMJ80_01230 [bacterium SM23_31]
MAQILTKNNTATYTAESAISTFPIQQKELKPEKKIIYKEIHDEDELLEMFALRSLVYQYVNFFKDTDENSLDETHLDIDCYDLYSTFIGAFEIIKNSKRLIGTMRIISGDQKSPSAPFVESVYETLPDDESKQTLERPALFPHLETFNVPFYYYSSFFKTDEKLDPDNPFDEKPYEISRLAVLPEYWKSKFRVVHGLHEMLVLSSWKAQPKRSIFIIATHPNTKQKYERIGFHVIPGTEEKLYKGINQPAILMRVNMEEYLKIPNPYIKICSSAYPHFLEKGYYTREEIHKTVK